MASQPVSDPVCFEHFLRRHYPSVNSCCALREDEPLARRARAWAILLELYRVMNASRVLH